jgi:hypothetical protein
LIWLKWTFDLVAVLIVAATLALAAGQSVPAF